MASDKMSDSKKIKFSIITVSYNSAKTIRDTLESIRNQDYGDIEYIIVDGGSTDGTLDIIAEYQDIVTKMVSEPDHGISDAMNKGIRMATGDIIGIIHSDDMLHENALRRIEEVYDESIDVYYGDCLVCDESGRKMHILTAKSDLSDMPYSFGMIHPSTFITRKAYEKWGLYSTSHKYAMDYELLLRFYKKQAVMKYINAALAVYRIGGTNQIYRKKTIMEVRNISIHYGSNPVKAEMLRLEKMLKDCLRPLLRGVKSRRVKKLQE